MSGDVLQITVPGVIAGGAIGQVLAKASVADRDTEWVNGLADVVGGRLDYVSTTQLQYSFLQNNQLTLFDGDKWSLVFLSSAPTLANSANDMNGDAITYAVVHDFFYKWESATSMSIQLARWAVSTAGSSARTGAWVTTTAYKIGQRVSNSGNYYPCLISHTSGTFADDLAAGKWGPAMTGTGDLLGLDVLDGRAIYSNTGDWRKYRYGGLIILYNDTGAKFRNTAQDASISNYYNEVPGLSKCYNDYAGIWTYNSATLRESYNGTNQHRGNFLLCKTQTMFVVLGTMICSVDDLAGGAYVTMAFNDVTTDAGVASMYQNRNWLDQQASSGSVTLSPGLHFMTTSENYNDYTSGHSGTYNGYSTIYATLNLMR